MRHFTGIPCARLFTRVDNTYRVLFPSDSRLLGGNLGRWQGKAPRVDSVADVIGLGDVVETSEGLAFTCLPSSADRDQIAELTGLVLDQQRI